MSPTAPRDAQPSLGITPIPIESAANERYRRLLALTQSSRERRKRERVLIEGVRALESWLEQHPHGQGLDEVFVTARSLAQPRVRAVLARIPAPCLHLSDALFRSVSQVVDGPGPIAVVATPRPSAEQRIAGDALYLDGVQDPGNIGTVLRTCAAVEMPLLLTSPDSAFCWAPKVLRAAAGAHFALTIEEGVAAGALAMRLDPGIAVRTVVAPTQAHDAQILWDADLRAPALWIFGGEGQGVRDDLLGFPGAQRVVIPQSARVESLNVGVAVALCLYEQQRQRRAAA